MPEQSNTLLRHSLQKGCVCLCVWNIIPWSVSYFCNWAIRNTDFKSKQDIPKGEIISSFFCWFVFFVRLFLFLWVFSLFVCLFGFFVLFGCFFCFVFSSYPTHIVKGNSLVFLYMFSKLYFLRHFQALREKLLQSTPKNKLISLNTYIFRRHVKVKVPAPNDY